MNADTFPQCLILSADSHYPDWVVTDHNNAIHAFISGRPDRAGILPFLAGLDSLAAAGMAVDPFGVANVWNDLLNAATDLLNYETGRLNPGTLSSFLTDLSRRVKRDPRTGDWTGDDDDTEEVTA